MYSKWLSNGRLLKTSHHPDSSSPSLPSGSGYLTALCQSVGELPDYYNTGSDSINLHIFGAVLMTARQAAGSSEEDHLMASKTACKDESVHGNPIHQTAVH